jgi:hypothetical protein
VLAVRKALAIAGLAALFVSGAILAGAGLAQSTATTPTDVAAAAGVTETSTELVTTTELMTTTEAVTTTEVTTAPAAEPVTTTVEHTVTRRVIVPATTTTGSESSSGSTPTWVWVLLGILALAIGVLVFMLASRGGGSKGGVSPEERRRRVDGTVATWAAQGWAVDTQTGESAVLRRGGELMLVTVDEAGHVNTHPLDPGSQPRSTDWP